MVPVWWCPSGLLLSASHALHYPLPTPFPSTLARVCLSLSLLSPRSSICGGDSGTVRCYGVSRLVFFFTCAGGKLSEVFSLPPIAVAVRCDVISEDVQWKWYPWILFSGCWSGAVPRKFTQQFVCYRNAKWRWNCVFTVIMKSCKATLLLLSSSCSACR